MSIDTWADERRSALADMSLGEIQEGCQHRRLNRYGECAACGEWMTEA